MYKHRFSQSPQRPSTIRYTGNNPSTPSPPESHHNPSPGGAADSSADGDLAGLGSYAGVHHNHHRNNRAAHESSRAAHESSRAAHDSGRTANDSGRTAHESGRTANDRDGFASSTTGLGQELKTRWEKPVIRPLTGMLDGGLVPTSSTPFTATADGGFNGFRAAAAVKQESAADIAKAADDGGPRPTTRWAASFHRRTASDAELDATTSTTQLGDDDGSGSSLQGSFHGGEDGVGSEEMARKRRCLVCDDSASGYHYGVSSCEACKAFFKRTIQGNIEYACPAANSCPIDKRRRKACQACRYKKCLIVGMLKEGVRLDRVRGGRQKYRRANNGEPIMVQTPLSQSGSSGRRSSAGVHELSQLLASLLACEPDSGLASVTDRMDTSVKLQSVLCDLADRDLVGIIGWAKQIPGFPELPLNDQMHLLQSTWCEILLFSLCVRSIETPQHGVLLFTEDFPVDEAMAQEAGFDMVHAKACRLVDSLRHYRITREEYVLIKCIILLNGGCVLESTRARDTLRDTIVQSLHQFVEGAPRSSNLLLLLPHLRQLDGLAKQYWFMIKNDAKITMHKLFLEMLESAQQLA